MKWDTKLAELSCLQKGWDSYDGNPIAPEALMAARGFLEGLEKAWVVPVPNGGVQIEWHVNGVDVEIEFGPDGQQDV